MKHKLFLRRIFASLLLLAFSTLSWADVVSFLVDGIYYDGFDDGNAWISWGGDTKHATIPSSVTYEGKSYRVTRIGDSAFKNCTGLTSVSIPSSVKTIGDFAFSGCSGLTSITIPNSVTSIGDYAFQNCSGLTSVTINSESIGHNAFNGCSGLTSVTIGNSVTSIDSWAFSDCSSLTSVTIPESVTSMETYAFYGCSALTSVTINSNAFLSQYFYDNYGRSLRTYFGSQVTEYIIGNSVTHIGGRAFYECTNLTSVSIPNSVTSIGESAFQNCSGLKSITIPESVTSIESSTFYGCSGLKSITIPESVTSIGDYTFYGCSGLKSVTIGNSVTSIGEEAFSGCSGLTKAEFSSIENLCKIEFDFYYSNPLYYAHHLYVNGDEVKNLVIPNSVTHINGYAFVACSGLTSITIPNSVKSIGIYAFWNCSGLTSVTIGNSVTSIGSWAFSDCSSLTSVTIPESVTSIGSSAFSGCSGLTSITIPESVTSIGWSAFRDCSSLKSVTCLAKEVPSSDGSLFNNVSLNAATLYVLEVSVDAYKKKTPWKNFGKIVPLTVPATAISINETELIVNKNASFQLRATVEPNYVSQVVTWTSSNPTVATISKSGLVTAVAPGVATITATTTDGTNLTASCQVTVNGTDMSGKCGDNVYFEISADGTMVISGTGEMGDYASSTNIPWYDNRNNIKSVVIEDGVTSIGNRVFYLCTALTSVTIPSSVTRIGDSAFRNCSSLTTVTCFAEDVPSMGSNVFYNASQNKATLYVPTSSLDAYKTADQWKLFVKKMPIDVLTVKDMKRAKALKTNSNAPIYDLMGRRLKEKPAKGYYIQGGKKYLVK